METGVSHQCKTCQRWRPEDEFKLPTDTSDRVLLVTICRPCRVKLWDNPDDAGEGYHRG